MRRLGFARKTKTYNITPKVQGTGNWRSIFSFIVILKVHCCSYTGYLALQRERLVRLGFRTLPQLKGYRAWFPSKRSFHKEIFQISYAIIYVSSRRCCASKAMQADLTNAALVFARYGRSPSLIHRAVPCCLIFQYSTEGESRLRPFALAG